MTQPETSSVSPPPNQPSRQPGNYHRTLEEHDAVRRRAFPVSACAAVCGIAGLILLLATPISAFSPPNLLGISLAFFAMPMGIGMIFYAKGTSGTRGAAALCLAAIVLGIAASLIYVKQAVNSRILREGLELRNLSAIAAAAKTYAGAHEGRYPPDLLVLLETKLIAPETLQSAFGEPHPLLQNFDAALHQPGIKRDDLLKSVETTSDYLYIGGDLHDAGQGIPKEIMIAAHAGAVLRVWPAVFGDGEARFVPADDAVKIVQDSNVARSRIGLGPAQLPSAIQKNIDDAIEATGK